VARVFRGEAEACAYVSRHPKNEGEMLVLHNGGARAGLLASCLKSSGAGCWVLSDGEISGRCPNPKGLRLPCRPGMERALKEGGRVKIDFKAGTFEAEAETGEKAATPEWTAFDGLERERLAGFGFMGSEL
jgi:dihydroxyacid dehydratase/phosphogluconate dehydratase